MPKMTITIAIDVDIDFYENKSGLSESEISRLVYDNVLPERNELAMEARICAIKILNGEDHQDDA